MRVDGNWEARARMRVLSTHDPFNSEIEVEVYSTGTNHQYMYSLKLISNSTHKTDQTTDDSHQPKSKFELALNCWAWDWQRALSSSGAFRLFL